MADSLETLCEEFLEKCWNTLVVKPREYIYVSQVVELIDILNAKLGFELLTKDQRDTLNSLISANAVLKLYRSGLRVFLLKLVNSTSLAKVFQERLKVSRFNLELILKNDDKTVPKPKSPFGSEKRRNLATSTPLRPRAPVRPRAWAPESPLGRENNVNGLRSRVTLKEKHINDRDDHISVLTKENQELRAWNREQAAQVTALEAEVKSLKSYVSTLEAQVNKNSTRGSGPDTLTIRQLTNKCNEKDNTIKMLQELCEKYSKELDKLAKNPLYEKLTTVLHEQEELIARLRKKLKIEETVSPNQQVQKFVMALPYVKQYYMAAGLVHALDQSVDVVLSVSGVTTLDEVEELSGSETTVGVGQLERVQEVVGALEVGADSVDLVDQVLDRQNTVFAQVGLDDGVVRQSDSLLVDLTVTSLVDQLSDGGQVGVTVGDVRLGQLQQLGGSLGDSDEDTGVDLVQSQQAQDLSGLWRDLGDTLDSDDESQFGAGLDVVGAVGLSVSFSSDDGTLSLGVFGSVGGVSVVDGLSLLLGSARVSMRHKSAERLSVPKDG